MVGDTIACRIYRRCTRQSTCGYLGLLLWVFKRVLLVSSLGVQQLRDLPYSLAAQNPYDFMAAALAIILPWFAPPLIARLFSLDKRGLSYWIVELIMNLLKLWNSENADKPKNEAVQAFGKRRLAFLDIISNVFGILLAVALFLVSINVATAIGLRQAYENKAAIRAPTLNPEQRVGLNALFANMRTKKEWELLMALIQSYSDQDNKKLFPPGHNPFKE